MYPEPPMELLGLVSVTRIVLCREGSKNIYDEPLVFYFVNKTFFIPILLVPLFRDFRRQKLYLHSSGIKTASLTSRSLRERVEILLRSVIYNFSLDLKTTKCNDVRLFFLYINVM